jgi:hypothetical protein
MKNSKIALKYFLHKEDNQIVGELSKHKSGIFEVNFTLKCLRTGGSWTFVSLEDAINKADWILDNQSEYKRAEN